MNRIKVFILGGLQETVEASLEDSFDLRFFNTSDSLLADIVHDRPSIVIIDLKCFDSSLRKNPACLDLPILFLSETKDAADFFLGMGTENPNCLVKPFSPTELRARVDEIIGSNTLEPENLGALKIDHEGQKLFVSDEFGCRDVGLTAMEFKLIKYFVDHIGDVISREHLLNQVWGEAAKELTDRSVDAHISSIRRKLRPFGHYIASVYGMGYRFELEDSSVSGATKT